MVFHYSLTSSTAYNVASSSANPNGVSWGGIAGVNTGGGGGGGGGGGQGGGAGGSGIVLVSVLTSFIFKEGWLLTNKATYYFPFFSDYLNYATGSAVSVGLTAYNTPTFITNTNTSTSALDSTCLYCNDSSSQYALSTTISMTGNTTMSIAFWVKSNKVVSGTPYWGRMFTMQAPGSGSGAEISFGISPTGGGGDNLMHCQKGGTQFLQSPSSINNNTWNFVVLVFSGVGVALYLNGSTTAQASGSMNVSLAGYAYTIMAFGGIPATYPNDYANVTINNFAIYNGYALTSTDITTLYNLGY